MNFCEAAGVEMQRPLGTRKQSSQGLEAYHEIRYRQRSFVLLGRD